MTPSPVQFVATEAATDESDGVIVTGVKRDNPDHYVMFQRTATIGEDDDDPGPYIEYNDQINAGTNNIESCRLQRQSLEILLNDPIGNREKYSHFRISLAMPEEQWNSLADGLRHVFSDCPGVLKID